MSDAAKKARAAMKAKAQRLGSDRPTEKVDSSTWTPAELLNADVKTGMRPISRRAFKKGGKVMGECAPARADRAPRKSGGKAITADSLINRNQKEANESREGKKHIGGMKKGGRAGKTIGGGLAFLSPLAMGLNALRGDDDKDGKKSGGRAKREEGGKVADYDTGSRTGAGAVTESRSKPTLPMPQRRPAPPDYDTGSRTGAGAVTESRKSGGRTKKLGGGALGPAISGAAKMMQQSDRGIPSATMNFSPIKKGSLSPMRATGMKKGGEAHEDVAADKALIKKMVKPSARTGKDDGGAADGDDGMKKGGRAKRATGGQVFSGPGYPGKIPGVVPGGRTARKDGGKTKGKGKTAINIVINAGKADDGSVMPPPPGPMGAPKGLPVPLPPAGAGMAPGAAPPMPMPPPGLAGAGAPPMPPGGMPPMGRKAGGRTYRSYKDMDAGAGSGMGRLEKTEIAEHKRSERRAGGRTYRSYKDMDAGSGSGLGRIEKSEIASRKSGIDSQNY